MPRRSRWPDAQTILEKAQQGIIDDTETLVPLYDLEEWEILGQPPPEEAVPAQEAPQPTARSGLARPAPRRRAAGRSARRRAS